MEPNKQRIAIAEWMGWTQIEDKSENLMMPAGYHVVGYPPKIAIIGRKQPLPDYLNDLNAMHEAEKKLISDSEIAFDAYVYMLDEQLGSGMKIHATAAQRAEALLKTIGKWES